MASLPPDFHARVRAARAYAGISSQRRFGELIEVSGSTVKNYESGKFRPDDRSEAETVKRLAKASGLPEWFFTLRSLNSLRLGAGETSADQRLDAIQRSLDQLVGLLSGSPEVRDDLFEEVVKTVERGLTQQAREAGRPSQKPASDQDHPPRSQKGAA